MCSSRSLVDEVRLSVGEDEDLECPVQDTHGLRHENTKKEDLTLDQVRSGSLT